MAQVTLWDATFDRIGRFLPTIQADLFPTPNLVVPFENVSRGEESKAETVVAVDVGEDGKLDTQR